MKKLMRERVVPTISAKVSWLIFGITFSGVPSLPKFASSNSTRARRFSVYGGDLLSIWRAEARDVSGGALDSGHYLAEEVPLPVTEAFERFFV